jgi:hypothetical protein
MCTCVATEHKLKSLQWLRALATGAHALTGNSALLQRSTNPNAPPLDATKKLGNTVIEVGTELVDDAPILQNVMDSAIVLKFIWTKTCKTHLKFTSSIMCHNNGNNRKIKMA